MHERRRNSKWLPELFLLLQFIAMFLFSYISYDILLVFAMPAEILLPVLLLANIIYAVKFYNRYVQVKNRTRYMEYCSK